METFTGHRLSTGSFGDSFCLADGFEHCDSGVMSDDFYCDEALSGRTPVQVVVETDDVLAFHHTRPFGPIHIVVVPKVHVPSLTDLGEVPVEVLSKVIEVVRHVAADVESEHGACRVLTNRSRYQDSRHLHFHVSSGEPMM